MVPEMEKPQVTEIKVRMDCNGCVQKIKKALQGIAGIDAICFDFPEQKLTITGWAEPDKLVKAIRKTRKSAVICVYSEESNPPESEAATHEEDTPPPEQPQTEVAPPAEAPDNPPPPQPENPPPATRQPHQPTRPNDEGVHVVYQHQPDHRYQNPNEPWKGYHGDPGFRDERYPPPPPVYVQSYNTYRPSPHVTEYAYPRPPPPRYSNDMRPDHAYPRPPAPRYSYDMRPDHYSGPGLRDEPPPQPPPAPRCSYGSRDHYSSLGPRDEPTQQPPPPRYSYDTRPDHYLGSKFRDEPPQPPPHQQPSPQPIYATHSYNTYKPSPYVTGYAYPRSPPRHPTYTRPENSSRPGERGEGEQSQPSQPPQPVYATHSHNIYRPSPFVTEYAYPESSPRYPSYSIPDNYSRDYYNGSQGNGNVTSMFSEENPNACRIV